MELYLADLTYNNSKWSLGINELIEEYTSVIWTNRWQVCGDFVLCVPSDSIKTITDYNQLINKVLILRSEMIDGVTRPDDYMLIEKVILTYNYDDIQILQIEGRDLKSILGRRIIWGLQSFETSQTIKSAVDTLVTDAIINPSDTNRKINGFEIGTYTASDTFTAEQQSYTNLMEVIIELCGAEYSPTIVLTDKFTFSLYQGANRTMSSANPLIFSEGFDNLDKYEYLRDVTDYKNAWLIGGEGEGAERKLQSNQWTDGTGLLRREIFIDANDISSDSGEKDPETQEPILIPDATYNQMLQQRIEEKRLETWIKESTTAELNFESVIYGVDYSVGDKATVVDPLGNAHNIRITEFIRSDDENGYKEYPNFEILGE